MDLSWIRRPPAEAAPARHPNPVVMPAPADDDRCGWLDSSLDLRHGLAVIEHPALDLGLTLDLLLASCAVRPRQASLPAR